MITIILVLLFSLVAPLPLLIIEKFIPYPFIVEEVLNLILVLVLLNTKTKIKQNVLPFVILSGILFTISESIFYLSNILASQSSLIVFFQRLFLTGTLHVGTLLILFFFMTKKTRWWILGFMIAVLIHFLFNYLILML